MELRARIPATLRRAAFVAALVALAAPATAGAATTAKAAKKKVKAPVVTKVSPLDVAVGETLTIRGRNFIKGRNKNTVVFKRDGARAVFAKAGIGTKKMLAIKVPASLQEFFATQAGTPQPTRFRIRVLAKTFAKKYTKNKWSPIVSGPRDQQVVDSKPDGDCDGDGAKNRSDTDDDNDGLADDIEISLGLNPCAADSDGDGELDKWEFDCDRNGVLNRDQTDDDGDLLSDEVETAIGSNPCVVDTDGDGVEDGYEYQSAKDLNDDEYQIPNAILAYPYKTPYPNPGFADAEVDYDGDGIALGVEYKLWKYTGHPHAVPAQLLRRDAVLPVHVRLGPQRPARAGAGLVELREGPGVPGLGGGERLRRPWTCTPPPGPTRSAARSTRRSARSTATTTCGTSTSTVSSGAASSRTATSTATARSRTTSATRTPTASPTCRSSAGS